VAEPFSVLLPVYDGDDAVHFRRAIASATAEQVRRPDELVVVRDGPVGDAISEVLATLTAADGAPDLVSGVPVRVVNLARNLGLALALQAGLSACRYEIVARVDADDVSRPERFAIQVPLIEGGLDLVGSAIVEFDVEESTAGIVRVPPLTQAAIETYARFLSPFNHPSVVYRRAAVQAAGGYRHLPLMEDYWLFARMLANGARVANVAEPLVLYRVGAGAYRRRGGLRLLRSEVRLQLQLRRDHFTSTAQCARNIVVRGGYRLVPHGLRRRMYRALVLGSRGRSRHEARATR
jgi:glycosyltransferase involved in cell wall biosynthesis